MPQLFSFKIDTSEFDSFRNNMPSIELEIEKSLRFYMNQVYADLSKIHGRKYSYTTPPASSRTVLRQRTHRLLDQLKNSRFVTQKGDTWEAGFKIRSNSYLGVHEGSDDASDVIIEPVKGEYLVIPLSRAMNADGSSRRLSGRHFAKMMKFYVVPSIRKKEGKSGSGQDGGRIIPITIDQLDTSGESAVKLAHSLILGMRVGRRIVPYFILARRVHIKKRLFIYDSMTKFYDTLYTQLDKEVEKSLKRMAK